MSLKRKLSSSAAAASSPSSSSSPTLPDVTQHPLFNEIQAANSSRTRAHSERYHSNVTKKFDITQGLHSPLLAWYGTRGSLPWRSDLTDEELKELSEEAKAQRAYEVWVSEIMLQQTQVATVIPYYKRWMAAFPTVADLASAHIDSVNGIWKGLGYYSRASRLLDGAKTVVNSFAGKLPPDPDTLVKKIEGIGPYTAGAIASIAYGVRAPTVDGNIQRVICRLLAIHADMKKKATLDYIWEVADELVPEKRAGHWNQALMDLGATVCTPKNPKCGECPLKGVCLANAEVRAVRSSRKKAYTDIEDAVSSKEEGGTAKKPNACKMCLPFDPPSLERDPVNYPMKVVKKKSRDDDISVCVVEFRPSRKASSPNGQAKSPEKNEGLVLLVKRPKTGLLAGLDEFPSVVLDPSTPDAEGERDRPTVDTRNKASLALLQELLLLPKDFAIGQSAPADAPSGQGLPVSSSSDLGSVKHIYSHINATFHVWHLVIVGSPPPTDDDDGDGDDGPTTPPPRIRKKAKERCRWVPRSEVEQANISTGAAKVWALVCAGGSGGVDDSNKRKGGLVRAKTSTSSRLAAASTMTKRKAVTTSKPSKLTGNGILPFKRIEREVTATNVKEAGAGPGGDWASTAEAVGTSDDEDVIVLEVNRYPPGGETVGTGGAKKEAQNMKSAAPPKSSSSKLSKPGPRSAGNETELELRRVRRRIALSSDDESE